MDFAEAYANGLVNLIMFMMVWTIGLITYYTIKHFKNKK